MKKFSANQKVRLALVGCGRISEKHFEALNQFRDDIQLVAICDIDIEKCKAVKPAEHIKIYDNFDEMLNQEHLDIVTLCTPSGLHADQTIRAAKKGINIITEKPMATRWRDGLRMVKECDENNVKLFVVKQNRYNQTIQKLKEAIQAGRFGKIHMVHINVFWSRPQAYYDQAQWRGTWEFDGGALMNQASHYVDLLDWLIGPVEEIQCMTSTFRQIEVEDTAVLNVKWRNGALGSLAVTMLTYPKNFEGSIVVIGETGIAKIGGVAINEIECWNFSDRDQCKDAVIASSYKTASVYGFGHTAFYKNVLDSILYGKEPEIDGREGLKSLELLIAAYISAKKNQTMSLPLEY